MMIYTDSMEWTTATGHDVKVVVSVTEGTTSIGWGQTKGNGKHSVECRAYVGGSTVAEQGGLLSRKYTMRRLPEGVAGHIGRVGLDADRYAQVQAMVIAANETPEMQAQAVQDEATRLHADEMDRFEREQEKLHAYMTID